MSEIIRGRKLTDLILEDEMEVSDEIKDLKDEINYLKNEIKYLKKE